MDETAETALQNIEGKDKNRFAKALSAARKVFRYYGFEIIGRIEIMDLKTGEIRR